MDSTEISAKIRAAIKAKLEELGAYADEELPDYIMVMVANKKSRAQMTDDLNLFLGKNAPVFTKWLHEVLERLSSLSKAPTAKEPKEKKEKKKDKEEDSSSSKAKAKKDKRAKEEKEEKATSKRKAHKDENAAPPAKQPDDVLHLHADGDEPTEPPTPARKESRKAARHASPKARSKSPKAARSRSPAPTRQRSPPRRRQSASPEPIPARYGGGGGHRRDDRDGRLKQPLESGSSSGRHHRRISPPEGWPKAPARGDLDWEMEEHRREREAAKAGRPYVARSPPRAASPRRRSRSPLGRGTLPAAAGMPSRGRRGSPFDASPPPPTRDRRNRHNAVSAPGREDSRTPPRTRSSARRHESPEEYDPVNPAMASTVSVPPRPRHDKGVRPEGHSFLRAMKDVARSTTVTVTNPDARKRRAERRASEEKEVEVLGPAVRRARKESPELLLTRHSGQPTTIKDRLGGRKVHRSPSPGGVVTRTYKSKELVENLVIGISSRGDRRRVEMEAEDGEDSDDGVPGVRIAHEPKPPGEEDPMDEMEPPLAKSSSLESAAEVRAVEAGKSDVAATAVEEAVEIFLAPLKEKAEGEAGPRFTVTMEGVQEDFRQRLEAKAGMTASGEDECEIVEAEFARKPLAADNHSSSMDSSVTLDSSSSVEDCGLRRSQRQKAAAAAAGGFVLPDLSVPPPALPFVPAPPQPASFPSGAMPPAPKAVRCRFFPACQNADCPYIHPTKPCTNFPACRYGPACLYVHPTCKFGPACTRPDCAFAHGGLPAQPPPKPKARPPPHRPQGPPKKLLQASNVGAVRKVKTAGVAECRFGERCTNRQCTFAHSPQCKYGGLCTRSDCVFQHPEGRGAAATQMPPKTGRVTAKATRKAAAGAYKWTKPQADPAPTEAAA